jgi:hypothetical protein
VVDTDCHHGDGTQDIYWWDPDVLYISMHQDGRTLYPGSGFVKERGGGRGTGYTVNIPLPPGTSDWGFLYAPDICVLEGGYSIHGALQYVNLGIVLALAGEDFSGVREPDYDEEALCESADIVDAVKRVCDRSSSVYFNRNNDAFKPVDSFTRSIFYDTDMIEEKRQDSARSCPDCPGYRFISSESTRCALSAGVEAPVYACKVCREAALERAEEAGRSGKYASVQLIDRRSGGSRLA